MRTALPEGIARVECEGASWSKVDRAQIQSDQASARVQGMKIRAAEDPPKAAPRGFPYAHRTCAEWGPAQLPKTKPKKPQRKPKWRRYQMTDEGRVEDAREGSKQLCEAIRCAHSVHIGDEHSVEAYDRR
jgi:hypothetical protein